MTEIDEPANRDDRRERLWADCHAAYEAIQADPSAMAEFQRELDLWDSTITDGLESVEDHPGLVPDHS